MRINRYGGWMPLLVLFSVLPSFALADSINQAAMLSITCAGCHGTDGRSTGTIPGIAGKSAEHIERAMLDFKAGKRPSTVMGRHAKGYSDAEIKLIAKYFASKKSAEAVK
jgi:sulfide dehydrogenase cytochrome subunit